MHLRLALALVVGSISSAATATTWTATSGPWTTTTNWTNGAPSAGVAAEIHNGGTLFLGSGPAATAGALNLGAGSLSLLDGRLSATSATLGDIAGALGQLTLARQGSISQWTVSGGSAILGAAGVARITVQSSLVTTTGPLVLGQQPGSRGDILLSGSTAATSVWSVPSSAPITIGQSGVGDLAIASRATFTVSGNSLITLGANAHSTGEVTVDGANALWQTPSATLLIGGNGTGSFALTAGATARTGAITLGQGDLGSGSLLLDGVGTQWQAQGLLTIGQGGPATLRIQAGAQLTSYGAHNTLGYAGGPAATALVTGDGTQWLGTSLEIVNGSLTIADSARFGGGITLAGAAATLLLGDGAQLDSPVQNTAGGHIVFINSKRYAPTHLPGGDLEMRGAGTLVFQGGDIGPLTITTGTAVLTNTFSSSPLDIRVAGTLAGTGGVLPAITLGGTLSPGDPGANNSLGTFRASALDWSPGGAYAWQIDNANAPDIPDNLGWDRLQLEGPLRFASAPGAPFTLRLLSGDAPDYPGINGFDPARAYIWTVATASGGIEGFDPTRFLLDTTNFKQSLDGTLALIQTGDSLQLTYTPVPEPTTLALLALAGLGPLLIPLRGRPR